MSTPVTSPELYSSSFFSQLTFGESLSLELPPVLPPGSLLSFSWESIASLPLGAKIFSDSEPILHRDDLRGILGDIDGKKCSGYNSVLLHIRCCGSAAESRLVSFAKIRCMVAVHNNSNAVASANALFKLVRTQASTSGTWTNLATTLESKSIKSPATGFLTKVPLWSLGCLTWHPQEQDVFDTVMDLRLEASALQHRLSHNHQRDWILCPTMFIHSLRQLHAQTDQVFNPELASLRAHVQILVQTGRFQGLVFLDCDGSHWVSYIYDGSPTLRYGDSLGASYSRPGPAVRPALNWLLKGLGLPLISQTVAMDVRYQGPESRSCALAAFNAVEMVMEMSGVGQWVPESGNQHRLRWIEDILVHHQSASAYAHDSPVWYGPSPYNDIAVGDDLDSWENSYAWDCWNLRPVLVDHPFCLGIKAQSENVGHPLGANASAQGFASQSPAQSFHPNTPSPPDKLLPSQSSLEPVSPSRSGSDSSLPSLGTTRKPQAQVIYLSSSPPPLLPAKRSGSPSIIEISSDDDGLSVPPQLHGPKKPRHRGGRNKRSRQQSSSVIIISDSDDSIKFTPQKRRVKAGTMDVQLATEDLPSLPVASCAGDEAAESSQGASSNYSYPPTSLRLHQSFPTLEAAIKAVLDDAEARQIVMRRAQKFDDGAGVKKVSVRCQCYQHPRETHNPAVHPGNQRQGRSNRTNCMAHVNINRVPGSSEYYLTLIHDVHNHPPILPVGGRAHRAPTETQQEVITRYATQGSFNRRHVEFVLSDVCPDRPLEARQISNAIASARRRAREEIASLGGDAIAVLRRLEELKEEDPCWRYRTQFSEDGTLTALWWQSPEQANLLAEYPDVLINDCTYNRNQYGYPLNIGVGIDRLGHSRNLWYALHAREDATTHQWVLKNHLDHAPRSPDIFASDRDPALEAIVPQIMPTTYHIVCLHHMEGNLTTNLRPTLGGEWNAFLGRFWGVYRAVSPEIFESMWQQLLLDYPTAEPYLSSSLYPIRHRWAHPWIACRFTAGIRTNGRVESENRTNKLLGGPKTSLVQLFENLNQRTREQVSKEQIAVRNASRRKHPGHWEPVFARVLTLCETYLGGFGLQTLWREMEKSCAYHTEVIPVPSDLSAWGKTLPQREAGFQWVDNEEKEMINEHKNDGEYIALPWLIHQVTERRLDVRFIVRVTLRGTTAQHIVLLLSHDRHICDCCMGVNLGLPCRHYFAALTVMVGMRFHLSSIHPRWLKSSTIDPSTVPPVTLDHAETQLLPISGVIVSNPLHLLPPSSDSIRRDTPTIANQTLAPQEVNRHAQSALKVATRGITTQAELDHFMGRMAEIQTERQQQLHEQQPTTIRDPPALNPRGRPRTSRLASAREGTRTRTRAQTRLAAVTATDQGTLQQDPPVNASATLPLPRRLCGKCRGEGHNRRRCPN